MAIFEMYRAVLGGKHIIRSLIKMCSPKDRGEMHHLIRLESRCRILPLCIYIILALGVFFAVCRMFGPLYSTVLCSILITMGVGLLYMYDLLKFLLILPIRIKKQRLLLEAQPALFSARYKKFFRSNMRYRHPAARRASIACALILLDLMICLYSLVTVKV